MITTKQRAYLRKIASTYNSSMQIGKDGLKDNSIVQIEEMLDKNELVKVKILKNCDDNIKELAQKISNLVGCDVVQVIGGIVVFYRKSKRKDVKHIDINI